jgi:branched-chain amino acid transport system permease protein
VRTLVAAISLTVLFVVLPLFTARNDLLNLCVQIFLAVVLAQSWNLLGGYAGQINLGHAAFFGLGALVTRTLWVGGTPLIFGLIAGALVATLYGTIIGIPAFRLRGAYFAIGTLGLAEILRITVGNLMPEISTISARELASYNMLPRYYLTLSMAVLCVAVVALLIPSRVGLGIRAVREDEAAAEATGVDALRHKLLALTISTAFAGLAGGAFAYYHVS